MSTAEFTVDAVLFDMDGTLVDSIAAVEAAWGKVADDIGQDRDYVIAATHGKRAIDNLKQFKPHIKQQHMPKEVQAFEETILAFADEYGEQQERRKSRANSRSSSFVNSEGLGLTPRELSPTSSRASSRVNSTSSSRRPSMGDSNSSFGFSRPLFAFTPMNNEANESAIADDEMIGYENLDQDLEDAIDLEEDVLDRSVQILPGVRRMIDSIPKGRYCVATSGAKTYAYGAMTRVGITPPEVTITADDPRLKNGKPFPDPFLLAAKELGFDAKRCVVFEDSPSGIRAGVASGATVVALCTSHPREKIKDCGAHYLLTDMEQIHCHPQPDGSLKFVITGLEENTA